MKFFKLLGFAFGLLLIQINSPIQAESYSTDAESAESPSTENQSVEDEFVDVPYVDDQSTENLAPHSHHSQQSYQSFQSSNYHRSRQTLTFKLTRTLGEGCQTLIDNFTAEVSRSSNSRTFKTATGQFNFRSIANEWNNPNRYVTNVYRYDELNNNNANMRLSQSYAWATNEINGCINDSVLRQRIFSRGELFCDYTWETWENTSNAQNSSCQNNYRRPKASKYYRRRN